MGWKNGVTPEIFEGCLSTLGKLKVAWVRGVWVKIPAFFSGSSRQEHENLAGIPKSRFFPISGKLEAA